MDIQWLQCIIAFFLGVFTSAAVKGLLNSAKSKVQGA
jgi:hypothetical protein